MGAKDVNAITIGTCDVYINDQFVGYTGDEVVVNVARNLVEFFSGLPQVRVTAVVVKEEISATFEFKQIDAVNVSYALGKDGNVDPITVPGSAIVEVGGDTSIGLAHKLDLVHTFPDDRDLRITFWKAQPEASFELAFNTGNFLGIKSKWLALEDSTKAAGKRLMRIDIEDEVKS